MLSENIIEVPLELGSDVWLDGEVALETERLESLVSLLRDRAAKRSGSSQVDGARGAREDLGEGLTVR